MAISAQTNVPQLPPFKVVTVGKNYTYLWPTVRKKYQGRIIDAKGPLGWKDQRGRSNRSGGVER